MVKEREKLHHTCEDFLDEVMDFHDIPGIALGVLAGAHRFTGARGFRNYMTKAPMTADSIFHCVSLSKLFTSMGIMRLVEDGTLRLEDRLVELLPYLSIADRRCKNIRLWQMLSHTAGLADVEDYGWELAEIGERALKEYALSEEVCGRTLLWEPGTGGFRYSNIAYALLGLIISEKSKMTYEGFMSSELLKPLEMHDSTFLTFQRTGGSLALDAVDAAGLAMPHKKAADRSIVLEACYPYTRQHAPSSTLTSNVSDLLKWAEANLQGCLLQEALYEALWQPHAKIPGSREEHMGLGWFLRRQRGHILMGHEGSDMGFRGSFWICPERNTAIVLLSNISDAPLKKLSKKLFERIITV